jgi:methylornithine synthase
MAEKHNFKYALERALDEFFLGETDIVSLLSVTDEESQNTLFEAARHVRRHLIGDKIFMAGFVYFSTYCRNDCIFCYFRRSHKLVRYRKSHAEILDISTSLARSGVHLIDLTMGEDPQYHKDGFNKRI